MKNLLTKKVCPAKAFYSSLSLGFRETANSNLKFQVRQLFAEHGIRAFADAYGLMETLVERIDDKYFLSPFEKEEFVAEKVEVFTEIYSGLIAEGFRQVPRKNSEYVKVPVGNTEVTVGIDFFLEKNGTIFPVVFDFSTTTYTLGLGTKNYFGDDERFYLIWKAGQIAFPNETVIPAILFRGGRKTKDKSISFKRLFYIDLNVDVNYRNILESRVLRLAAQDATPKMVCNNEANCSICYFKNLCKMEKNDNSGFEVIEEIKKSSGKVNFTKAQEQVIAHRTGEMRVLAGAGSGKTTCLVNRIVAMIAEGKAKPKDFLLITFTEKGCREMREKLEYWMKEKCPNVHGSFMIETFNSFGQKVVQRDYQKLGFSNEPYLIDDILGYDILTELSQKGYRVPYISYHNPYSKMFRQKGGIAALYDAIKIYKDEVNSGCNITNKAEVRSIRSLGIKETLIDNYFISSFTRLVNKYNETLKNETLIDYSDQIYMCIELLKQPDVRAKWNFKHIIVDEFQDTSLSQMDMLQLLYNKKDGNSLLVCGDDAQAIFGFRGVGPENIINFKTFYSEAEDVYLVDNFRCTKQIVNLANKVIGLNKFQVKKSLIAHKEGEEVIIANRDHANFDENIVELVKREIAKGTLLKDICILAATRMECFSVRKRLLEEGIASTVSVAEKYVDDAGILGACGLANFLQDKEYRQGFLTYKNSIDMSYKEHVTKSSLKEDAEAFFIKIEGLNDEELYTFFMEAIKDLPQTIALNEVKAVFENRISKFSEIATYLNKLLLYSSDKTTEADTTNYNAVTISTIHASKGREFKVVIISNKKIDAISAGKEISKDVVESVYDEERVRLLYVAITRAMSRLYIVQSNNGLPSIILNELVPLWDITNFKNTIGAKIDFLSKANKGKTQ